MSVLMPLLRTFSILCAALSSGTGGIERQATPKRVTATMHINAAFVTS